MKIDPMSLIDGMHGKVSKTDSVHTKTRTADNQVLAVRVKHPYDGGNPPSTDQATARDNFTSVQAAAKAILHASSLDTDPANYNKLQAYKAAFEADRTRLRRKYKTFNAYVVHRVAKDA